MRNTSYGLICARINDVRSKQRTKTTRTKTLKRPFWPNKKNLSHLRAHFLKFQVNKAKKKFFFSVFLPCSTVRYALSWPYLVKCNSGILIRVKGQDVGYTFPQICLLDLWTNRFYYVSLIEKWWNKQSWTYIKLLPTLGSASFYRWAGQYNITWDLNIKLWIFLTILFFISCFTASVNLMQA